jgi:hypothetical protein
MILPPLPWRLIGRIAGVLAVVALVLWYRSSLIERGREEGIAQEKAAWMEAQERADREHNAKIDKLDKDYSDEKAKLQARVDALLARPATRTIRVPIASICPAEVPGNAAVPAPDPGDGLLEFDDPAFGQLRERLIRFAGGPGSGG